MEEEVTPERLHARVSYVSYVWPSYICAGGGVAWRVKRSEPMPTDPTAAVAESLNDTVDWNAVGGFVENYAAGLSPDAGALVEQVSVQVTLSARVAEQLREVGGGNVMLGIRRLLDQRERA